MSYRPRPRHGRLCLLAGASAPLLLLILAAGARAQDIEAAQTSRLTGVPLPAGAQRVLKKEFTADAVQTLEAMAKQMGKQCAGPEILLWTGATRPATDDAARAVSAQLEKAGYECKVLDAPEGMPPVLKKIMAAKNRKQAVLGFWAASGEMVTLAWCQVERFEDKPDDTGQPGAPPAADRFPAFPKLQPKPGTVIGTVLKMSGQPLAEAEITVRGTTMAGERTSFSVRTDEKGHYELPLPAGVYRMSMGTWETRYGGLLYKLPLRTVVPSDSIVSAKGHVGDWVLQIRGQVPDSDLLYGGYVQVQISGGRRARDVGWAPGTVVEVTLTPEGPLVDGSQGRPLLGRYQVPEPSMFDTSMLFTIPGVPVGHYRVAGRVAEPGKAARALDARITVFRKAIGDDTFGAAEKALYLYPEEAHQPGVSGARIDLAP